MKTNTIFTLDEIGNFVADLARKTQKGLAAVSVTEPKMRKRGNPYAGRVKKVTFYRDFLFASYANTVNGASATKSGATGTYVPEKTFCHHIEGKLHNVVMQSNTDPNQYYFNFVTKDSTTIRSTLIIDGKVATAEQVAEIEPFLTQSTLCKKQQEFGIVDEEQVKPLRIKLQNVVCLTDTPAEAKAVYAELTATA